MNGKGDKTRKSFVSYEKYASNWELAFGSKDKKKKKKKKKPKK